ncbi:hypothetical protein PRUPE_3G145600 [Prunus persica]|uniref:non-specific serine/threonine protein kinase n=1 Tax=Prunus persica TaxID=3760 RepID=A0A251Q070_PRUPE|nr:hypothetical protein PRUPE_3G145600 [Prunus persica]
MNLYPFQKISFLLVITSTICLLYIPRSLGEEDDEQYLKCSASSQCANFPNIGYPFWGSSRPNYCGYPEFKTWDASNNLCKQCNGSGGQCGYNTATAEFTCYCKDGPHPSNCAAGANLVMNSTKDNPVAVFDSGFGLTWDASNNLCKQCHRSGGSRKAIAIGIAVAVPPIIIIILFTICISRKRILAFLKRDKGDEFDVEAFIRNYGSLTPKRYTYANVKKMTDSFKDKIGKGGYGTVYKGRLPDGLLVAVKVLRESKGNGEDFINEVASIGRTSHVNIVTLSGFCYERDKRALIYEFMPNGSLDNFIHKHGSEMENRRLEWKTLSEIAVGIARGLEYLHRGCNTRILHFDIKPRNILLDKDFCPKISDFGLAKLCKTKESIVSMLGARGTAGYIAPEVFSRNFGGVSHKSDVYSYGMLILDMVGARKNLDSGVTHTSEMFPNYVYTRLNIYLGIYLRRKKKWQES